MISNHAFKLRLRRGEKHLIAQEKHWQELIEGYGKCQLLPSNRTPFEYLVRSIISQQLSSKAAGTIVGRVEILLGKQGFNVKAIAKVEHQTLRDCGLSNAKVNYCQGIAQAVLNKQLDFSQLHQLDTPQVIEQLGVLKGVGVWTAQMFCIFALGHLDVFASDDIGLQRGIQKLYALPEKPTKAEMLELTEKWQPYSSIASWYLWRIADGD